MLLMRRQDQADNRRWKQDPRDRYRAPRREARGHRFAPTLCRLSPRPARASAAPRRAPSPVRNWADALSQSLPSRRGLAFGIEQNPGQPRGEMRRVGRLFTFHQPRLVEKEPDDILKFFLVRGANSRGQGANQRMRGID